MIGGLRNRVRAAAKEAAGALLARRQPTRRDLPPSAWGLEIGPGDTLWRGRHDLSELVGRFGSPLQVALGDRLDANAAAAVAANDEVDVFYSYKSNPVPAILRRLHGHGVGAEVISAYELWLALRLGVPGDRIVYNGPAKSEASIRTAIRERVLAINANSVGEAAFVARLAAEERCTVRLGLRLSVPGTWGGQFGIADVPTVADAVRAALADPWVELQSAHVHRGGTMRYAAEVAAHVSGILHRLDELRELTGWHPTVLDIGGSLACPTSAPLPVRQFRLNRAFGTDLLPPDPADCISVAEAATLAASLVRSHADAAGLAPQRVLLEPGRALTGDTQLLLTTVVDVKDDGEELIHAVLDAGINVAEPVSSEYHQLFSVSAPRMPATTHYRLAGPICTPGDVLYNNWRLPPLEPGHVLAIMDTGAYFVPFSTTFSFTKPAIVIDDGDEVTVIRRREEFADVVALDELSVADGRSPDR